MPIDHDCKIHFDGHAYYLIVPYKKVKKHREEDHGIISLDPGVRTFQSGIDHERAVELGNGSGTRMFTLLRKLDNLISRKTKTKKRSKKATLTKQISCLRRKVQHLQTELHKKTSAWLCQKYNTIVTPQFGSKDMVKKVDRKLSTKTVRAMSMLGHGKFLERLKNKAEEWETNVMDVDERNTSKTCSACGHVKTKRFTSKLFTCEGCLLAIDRDKNGAINILKKLFLPSGENGVDRS